MANYFKLVAVNVFFSLLCFFERSAPENSQFFAIVLMFLAGMLSGYLIVEDKPLRRLMLLFFGLGVFIASWLVVGFLKDFFRDGKLGSDAVSFAIIAAILLLIIGGPIYLISSLAAVKIKGRMQESA